MAPRRECYGWDTDSDLGIGVTKELVPGQEVAGNAKAVDFLRKTGAGISKERLQPGQEGEANFKAAEFLPRKPGMLRSVGFSLKERRSAWLSPAEKRDSADAQTFR